MDKEKHTCKERERETERDSWLIGEMLKVWSSSSKTEIELYEVKQQESGPPFLTERQTSVRREAGSTAVLLRQRDSTVCKEMPTVWPFTSEREKALLEKCCSIGPPLLSESAPCERTLRMAS